MNDDGTFASRIAMLNILGTYPIIVHGGGPQIDALMKERRIPIERRNDKRITNQQTLDCVVEALSAANRELVLQINQYWGSAQSAIDQEVIYVEQLDTELGFVGKPVGVNGVILADLVASKKSPVLWCIGYDQLHQKYNVHADHAASAIIRHMEPEKFAMLVLVTSTGGVLDSHGQVMSSINYSDIHRLKEDGTITGGMAEKVLQAGQLLVDEAPFLSLDFRIQIVGPNRLAYRSPTGKIAGTRIVT